MASRIGLLDEATINQIAAGEVVDRPASALKELIENALDAGSTRVEIELEEGGLQLLRVMDNGCGMNQEEVCLAVERHATSKIASAHDLRSVLSFGFRGEALSSIAAVSRLEIISRPAEQPAGTRLTVEAGELSAPEPAGAPAGTRITVRDLFYNLPARRKFLKSAASELRAAVDVVSRLVLGNPQVAFKLQIPGRILIQSRGNNSLLEAVAAVYGPETAQQMLLVDRTEMIKTENVRIWGYVSKPSLTRNNRHQQSFLVNRRYIQSRMLQQAVGDACRGLLPLGRFPVVILHIELPPEMVDVNVHPAKMEVRFQDERGIFAAVKQAVRQALLTESAIPQIVTRLGRSPNPFLVQETWGELSTPGSAAKSDPTETSAQGNAGAESDASSLPWEEREALNSETPIDSALPFRPAKQLGLEPLPSDTGRLSQEQVFQEQTFNREGHSLTGNYARTNAQPEAEDPAAENPVLGFTEAKGDGQLLPGLVPKAQIADTYILAEGQNGLYILDQHAVHERILYEKILSSLETGQNYTQESLFPETLELTPEERERFTQYIIVFRDLGFVLEHFGGNTFLLRGVPTFIQGSGKAAFLDLLDYLADKSRVVDQQRLYQGMAARLACSQAVKAADSLNQAEMESLILQMNQLENPYACPHGRPTIIHLPQAELERRFQRK
jgi:DNA mismatch repair protein MutL